MDAGGAGSFFRGKQSTGRIRSGGIGHHGSAQQRVLYRAGDAGSFVLFLPGIPEEICDAGDDSTAPVRSIYGAFVCTVVRYPRRCGGDAVRAYPADGPGLSLRPRFLG